MSSVFISGIVGTGDYAVPEADAELTAAESGLTSLLGGVTGLSFSDLIAFVVTAAGSSPARTLGAFLADVEYVAEVCPDPTETTAMTAAIEAALLADADISAVGGQDVKFSIVPASSGLTGTYDFAIGEQPQPGVVTSMTFTNGVLTGVTTYGPVDV